MCVRLGAKPHTPSIKARVALAVMPEANAESTLENYILSLLLNIPIKTTSFFFRLRSSECQLCEVRTEKQTKNFSSRFFSFVLPPPYFLKRKRKFWFAYDGAVAEALVRLGLPRARMRMVSVGVTTDTERWLMFKIPFFGFVD